MLQSRLIFPTPESADLEIKLAGQEFIPSDSYVFYTNKRERCIVLARFNFHSMCNHSLKDSKITLDPVILGLCSFMYFNCCFSFLYEKESSTQMLADRRNSKKSELKTLSKETKLKWLYTDLLHTSSNTSPKPIRYFRVVLQQEELPHQQWQFGYKVYSYPFLRV